MYIPKYFSLEECFPLDFPKNWKYFDERILMTADWLREEFGPLWVNNKNLTQCGFRTNGSKTSQHRFGRALDLHSDNHKASVIRKHIIKYNRLYPYITFLEIDINWVHIDCRNTNGLHLWSPKRGFVSKENYLKTGEIK